MPVLISELFLRTFKESPSEADTKGHRLLLRAGYILRYASGIFAYLPLGYIVRQKIEKIVREEMRNAGAVEVRFPAVLPAALYSATGRLEEYGEGVFLLKDRKDASFILAPTHEEAFCIAAKHILTSYKNFPVTLFQIQDKYRDELRSRGGLLRGREFSMKDAYSFGVTPEQMHESYASQRSAYMRIFERLELDYVIVNAHSGAMGGSKSEEFLHPSPIGEDQFIYSAKSGQAANVEAFEAFRPPAVDFTHIPQMQNVETINIKTIDALAKFFDKDTNAFLKHVYFKVTDPHQHSFPVIIALEGSREVDQKRVEAHFTNCTVDILDTGKYPQLVDGFVGPCKDGKQFLGKSAPAGILYLVDSRIAIGSSWIVGANYADTHTMNVVYGRDFVADGIIDASEVRTGDLFTDGSSQVEVRTGVEIGHVFELGTKYSDAFGFEILDDVGNRQPVYMGSYGIGITRILALLAETYGEESALVWPRAVAPFDVWILPLKGCADVNALGSIVSSLEDAGLDVAIDDRNITFGSGVRDAELVGPFWIVIAGQRFAEGFVEVRCKKYSINTDVEIPKLVDFIRSFDI